MAQDPQNPQATQDTGTPDVQTILSDPNFHALDIGEKHKVLLSADPYYAGMQPKEQMRALGQVQYGSDPEKKGFWGQVGDSLANTIEGGAETFIKPLTEAYKGYQTGGVKEAGKRFLIHSALGPMGESTLDAASSMMNEPEKWQQRKAAGYSTPYRVLAAAAPTITGGAVNPSAMEEAASKGDTGAVAGEMATEMGMATTPLIAEIPGAIHDAMEPGRVAEGQSRVKGALQVTPGKRGSKASAMENDIDFAKGDLADIFRNKTGTKLKGSDAERFKTAADAIKDWKDNLWDTTHTAMVQNHGHLNFDNGAVLNKALGAIDPLDDSVQADAAREWANREIPKMKTLADADTKIRLLNQDPALTSGVPGSYDAVGKKVRFAALDATRQQLDTHLINDAGEQGLQDQPDAKGNMVPGVNKRWGALNNIEGQLRTRAEALEKGAAGKSTLLPKALHSYLFEHGAGLPTIGVAANVSRLLEKSPGKLLKTGLGKIADSRLTSPEVTLGQPTPPGQYPGGVSPTGPNFPQTPGGVAPMQPGPFRGLLPAAGATTGPRTSAGPGVEVNPANPRPSQPASSVPSQIPLPEGTTNPPLPPAKQIPEKAGPAGSKLTSETQQGKNPGTKSPAMPMPASPPHATVAPYLTGQHEFSIMSAENPANQTLSPTENKIRTANTLTELRHSGYKPHLVQHVENGVPGNSIFVPDMPTHEAMDFQDHMQEKYGYNKQSSIMTKQGIVDVNKKTATPVNHAKTIFGPEATNQPFHSIAGSGDQSLPFAFKPEGPETPLKAPYEGEHHTNASIKNGSSVLGSKRGAADPDTQQPIGHEADRLRKGNGAPGGGYFYDKGTLAEPQMAGRKNVYTTGKTEKSIATIEGNPLWDSTMKKVYQDQKAKGASDQDAHHIAANEAEHALMNAGYDGYRSNHYPGTSFLFGDTKVFRHGEEPSPPALTPHPNAPPPPQPTQPSTPGAATSPNPPKAPAKQAARPPQSKSPVASTPTGATGLSPNASGESSASLEAMNRAASEKASGVRRFRIDTRSGNATPIVGVDSVDAKPGPFDVIVQRGPKGETVLDKGPKARYPLPPKGTGQVNF